MDRKILILAGPTAVGKTEYSLDLAERLNGEIISADSMQLYKYMDIGSEKPTPEERSRAVHYLVDEVDPAEDFSVYAYKLRALDAIEKVFSKGKVPIISGGTGLYINALIYDMDFSVRPDNNDYRTELSALADTKGPEALHDLLKEKDPEAAERIHPNNVKKVIRALEILNSGVDRVKEFSEADNLTTAYDICLVGLTRERQELYDRINLRVDILMDQGLEQEVRGLEKMGLTEDRISMKGIGYKELFGYFRGDYSLETAVDLIKKNTRHYAKKQLTWLRRYPFINWVDLSVNSKEEALQMIMECWRR